MDVTAAIHALSQNIQVALIGKEEAIEQTVVAFLSGNHLLVEDVPGVGKTVLARALARSIGGVFRRVQFTPDLLPADVTGTYVFNQRGGDFTFAPGPVFANVLLADEINRATPRTQASLLEAMGEGQVTVEGTTHALPDPFFVIATQNPLEFHGTFPLPEGQLDRFGISLSLGYLSATEEARLLGTHHRIPSPEALPEVLGAESCHRLRAAVADVYVAAELDRYLVDLVRRSRVHPDVRLGASPRAALSLRRAAQALALYRARQYVLPDDIQELLVPALAHRLSLNGVREEDRTTASALLRTILSATPVPEATS
ncbi:MAG: MoxR family ATPase [Chloroflexi bacterium]|nr:MoxR family ATPase [Chloroflexota bacterium]